MNSKSLENMNGARCASVLELDSTGVTTGDGDTHDLRAAVRRPYSERPVTVAKPRGRALLTAKKARGGKISAPAPQHEREVEDSSQLVYSRRIAA